jgi:hypothetical protein
VTSAGCHLARLVPDWAIAQFGDLPLAILRSISAVSGETYQEVDQGELEAELSRRGFEPTQPALRGAMHALHDGGYLDCYFTAGGIKLIHLQQAGRQQVEGWPTSPGSLSADRHRTPCGWFAGSERRSNRFRERAQQSTGRGDRA